MRLILSGLVAAAILIAAFAALGSDRDPAEPVTPEATAAPDRTERPPPPRVAVVRGPDDLRAAARRLRRAPAVSSTSLLGRGTALLRTSREGYAIPLDVLAVDPKGYAPVLTGRERGAISRLRPGEAILSETSARLRGRTTKRLDLVGGRRLRVVGIVPDPAAQAAEVVVHARDPRVTTEARNVVVILSRDGETETSLARRAGRGARARFADDPRGRSGGGPARPAELKARFGEPAVGLPYGSDWVRLDPGFLRRHMVNRRVPVLGMVTCHRAMLPALRAAMGELARRGLSRLVDPGDYAGCYAPRRIRPGGALSLHGWGLAVDLNASRNPFGGRSHQDRRLVRAMERHGFTWGGDWPTARDPMHFEFRGR